MTTQKQAYREKMNKLSEALAVGMDCHGKVEDFGFSSAVLPTTLEDRLRIAIAIGSTDTVEKALSLGADANARSNKGYSMLDLAEAHNPSLVKLLKAYGAKETFSKKSPASKG